jgi:hypothetical protein
MREGYRVKREDVIKKGNGRQRRESTKGRGWGDEDMEEGAYSGEEGDGDMAMIVA